MSKSFRIVLIVVAAVAVVGAIFMYLRFQKLSGDLASQQAAREEVQDRYARTIEAIAEIQDSLNAIAVGDTGVGAQRWQVGSDGEPAAETGQEAMERIAVVRASVERNKERIRELEADLKKSGVRVAGLERMIAGLKETVAEKEVLIAQLTARVDTLQTEVGMLETAVLETQDTLRVRERTLQEKRRELATVYYAIGTKGELEKAGVVRERGGILGIGQTLVPVPDAPETAFRVLNTDQQTVLATGAKKARVVSAQPGASYELRLVDETMELHILDAGEFRKIKRLVIVTS